MSSREICAVFAVVAVLTVTSAALDHRRIELATERGYNIGQGVGMCAVADAIGRHQPQSDELRRLCAKARAAAAAYHLKPFGGKPT